MTLNSSRKSAKLDKSERKQLWIKIRDYCDELREEAIECAYPATYKFSHSLEMINTFHSLGLRPPNTLKGMEKFYSNFIKKCSALNPSKNQPSRNKKWVARSQLRPKQQPDPQPEEPAGDSSEEEDPPEPTDLIITTPESTEPTESTGKKEENSESTNDHKEQKQQKQSPEPEKKEQPEALQKNKKFADSLPPPAKKYLIRIYDDDGDDETDEDDEKMGTESGDKKDIDGDEEALAKFDIPRGLPSLPSRRKFKHHQQHQQHQQKYQYQQKHHQKQARTKAQVQQMHSQIMHMQLQLQMAQQVQQLQLQLALNSMQFQTPQQAQQRLATQQQSSGASFSSSCSGSDRLHLNHAHFSSSGKPQRLHLNLSQNSGPPVRPRLNHAQFSGPEQLYMARKKGRLHLNHSQSGPDRLYMMQKSSNSAERRLPMYFEDSVDSCDSDRLRDDDKYPVKVEMEAALALIDCPSEEDAQNGKTDVSSLFPYQPIVGFYNTEEKTTKPIVRYLMENLKGVLCLDLDAVSSQNSSERSSVSNENTDDFFSKVQGYRGSDINNTETNLENDVPKIIAPEIHNDMNILVLMDPCVVLDVLKLYVDSEEDEVREQLEKLQGRMIKVFNDALLDTYVYLQRRVLTGDLKAVFKIGCNIFNPCTQSDSWVELYNEHNQLIRDHAQKCDELCKDNGVAFNWITTSTVDKKLHPTLRNHEVEVKNYHQILQIIQDTVEVEKNKF